MTTLITGGAGFLGTLLAEALDEQVTIFDAVSGDDIATVGEVVSADIDTIFHLASVVSAGAERDFDAAVDVNIHGMLAVLDAARDLRTRPRFVFASSIAAIGTPLGTYGMTKRIGELLVDEYTRKGFVDGRTARIPTVIIRPGAPNAAASGFASAVFREPLAGAATAVPVPLDSTMVVIGHRTAVAGLAALCTLDGVSLGSDRTVPLPGLVATVAEMVAALGRAGGDASLVSVEPDAEIEAIVASWPASWDSSRALSLGLPADRNLDEIVAAYRIDFGVDTRRKPI